MIISCPNCLAKFAVKAEAIGAQGRKVRCAKCKHDWFQTPVLGENDAAPSPDPVAVDPIKSGANLPATVKEAFPLYVKLSYAGVIFIALISWSIISSNSVLPSMGWYYSMFGIYEDHGIILSDTVAEKSQKDGKDELLVKGNIINESNNERLIPDLRIKLVDKNHNELRVVTLEWDDTYLTPGESIEFKNLIQKLPENVDTVIMDIGNAVNLAAR